MRFLLASRNLLRISNRSYAQSIDEYYQFDYSGKFSHYHEHDDPPGTSALVTTDFVKQQFTSDNKFRLLHASLDSCNGYHMRHIPTAMCFDCVECRDKDSGYKNTLPSADDFAKYTESLGISNNSHVVVYEDNVDSFYTGWAARVWMMFKIFGHEMVSVMDGGLHHWIRDGGSFVSGPSDTKAAASAKYTARRRYDLTMEAEDVMFNLQCEKDIGPSPRTRYHEIVDGRSKSVFQGATETSGIKGHIPKAINVPFTTFVDKETRKFKSQTEIRRLFIENRIDWHKPIVTTCGTGVTACTINLAAYIAGNATTKLFDGSWNEWAARQMPYETGKGLFELVDKTKHRAPNAH